MELSKFIRNLQADKRGGTFDASAREYGCVLKILDLLGWDVSDMDEDVEEDVMSGRSEYCVINPDGAINFNVIFIRSHDDVIKHWNHYKERRPFWPDHLAEQIQLIVITDGLTWSFFLFSPLMRTHCDGHHFHLIDILHQAPETAANTFAMLLSKKATIAEEIADNVEKIRRKGQDLNVAAEIWIKAWNLAIADEDKLLVESLRSNVARLFGDIVLEDCARVFLRQNKERLWINGPDGVIGDSHADN